MAFYSTDSELYADLGECLRGVLCDPENADRARAVGSVIRIETGSIVRASIGEGSDAGYSPARVTGDHPET